MADRNNSNGRLIHLRDKELEKLIINMDLSARKVVKYDETAKKFILVVPESKYIKLSKNGFVYATAETTTGQGRKFFVNVFIGGKGGKQNLSHAHLEYMKGDKITKAKGTFVICDTKKGREVYRRVEGSFVNSSTSTIISTSQSAIQQLPVEKAPWEQQ